MALETKSVPVTFVGGQQSGSNPQTIGESSFTSLENTVSRRLGEYEKVNGDAALPSTLMVNAIDRPNLLNRAQFLTPGEGTSTTLWTSQAALPRDTGANNWAGSAFESDVPPLGLNVASVEPRVSSAALLYYTYVESADRTRAVECGWEPTAAGTGYVLRVSVINPITKVVLAFSAAVGVEISSLQATSLAGVAFTHGSSDSFQVAQIDGSGNLTIYKCNATRGPILQVISSVSIASVAAAKLLGLDAIPRPNAQATVAYTVGSSFFISIILNDNSLVTSVGRAVNPSFPFKDAAYSTATNYIYAAYVRSGEVYIGAFDPLNMSTSGTEVLQERTASVNENLELRIAAGAMNELFQLFTAGNGVVLYQIYDGDFRIIVGREWTGVPAAASITSATTAWVLARDSNSLASQSCAPASSARIVNGAPLVLVQIVDTSINSAYIAVSWRPVAKVLGGKATGFKTIIERPYTSTPINVSNNVARIGTTYIQDVRKISTGQTTLTHGTAQINQGRYTDYTSGSAVIVLNFDPVAIPVADTAEDFIVGSGVVLSYPKAFAGAAPVENTILTVPDIVDVTIENGGSLAAGAYAFAVVFEASDRTGRIYKSAPGGPSSVTVGSSSKVVTVSFAMSGFTYFPYLTPVLYMTELNGSILYRTQLVHTKQLGYTGIFTISGVASDLTQGEILYTEGGVLPNVALECVTSLTEHKGRIFAGISSPGVAYAYSKAKATNEPFTFAFDTLFSSESIAPLTAITSFEDKLLLFTAEDAYVVSGEGPSDTGSNNDLSSLVKLPYTAGVVNCNALAVMSDQLIFASNRGLVSLDRSLAVSPIAATQSIDVSSVTSMVYRLNQNELWIGTSAAGTIIYNHFTQTWSRLPSLNSLHAALAGNLYTRLTSAAGQIVQETAGAYAFQAAAIPQRLETAWMAMTGIEGYQRVYSLNMLGQRVTNPVTVYIDLYYNYDDATLVETIPYTYTSVATQIRIIPKIQKCTAIKLVIRESSTNAGFKFTGLQFEVGVKQGLNRAPR